MQTRLRAQALTSARARSCHTASQRSSFKSQHVSRTSPHTHTAPSGCCFIHHCSEVGGPQDPTPTEWCTWGMGGRVHVSVHVYEPSIQSPSLYVSHSLKSFALKEMWVDVFSISLHCPVMHCYLWPSLELKFKWRGAWSSLCHKMEVVLCNLFPPWPPSVCQWNMCKRTTIPDRWKGIFHCVRAKNRVVNIPEPTTTMQHAQHKQWPLTSQMLEQDARGTSGKDWHFRPLVFSRHLVKTKHHFPKKKDWTEPEATQLS